MKKFLRSIILLLILTLNSFSSLKAGWQEISTGSTAYLTSVFFIDAMTGFIGGLNGYLSKTTNGGLNWTIQNPIMTSQFVRDISFLNANTGFICGDDGYIRKTINGGVNWIPVTTNTTGGIYGIDAIDGQYVYASVNNGTVLRSTDGGSVFESISVSTNQLLTIDFCSADTGYTAGQGGVVYKTVNGGLNWSTLNASTLNNFWDICVLNSNSIYLAAYYGTLRKTGDGGNNFKPSFGYNMNFEDIQMLNTMIGYTCGLNGVLNKTTNGGNSWISQNSNTSESLNELFFLDSKTGYVAGTNGLLLKTTDGGDNFSIAVLSPNNREILVSGNLFPVKWSSVFSGNLRIEYSVNNGASWNIIQNSVQAESFHYNWTIPPGNSSQCRIKITSLDNPALTDISDGTFSIVASNPFYNVPEIIYYRFNNGTNSTPNYAVPGEYSGAANITGMTLQNGGLADSSLVGAGGNGLTHFVSTNWATTLPQSGWTIGFWLNNISLGADPNNAVYLFGDVTANNLRCYYGGAGGLTGTDTAIMFRCGGLSDIRIPVVRGSAYYIHIVYESSPSVIKTYVNGVLTQTVPQAPFFSIGNGPLTIGAHASFSSSLSQNMRMDEFRIYERSLSQSEISATWNVTFPIVITDISNAASAVYDNFVLHENFPNPFNPVTVIKFDVPHNHYKNPAKVNLTVFDILGKEVTTLVNGYLKAGNYSVEFNAVNFPSGLYFYKLESGNFSATGKMLLVK